MHGLHNALALTNTALISTAFMWIHTSDLELRSSVECTEIMYKGRINAVVLKDYVDLLHHLFQGTRIPAPAIGPGGIECWLIPLHRGNTLDLFLSCGPNACHRKLWTTTLTPLEVTLLHTYIGDWKRTVKWTR